jgi:site-specific recombinase XerC
VPPSSGLLKPLALVSADRHVDPHPVAVYLASLSSGSRPTMRSALEIVAALLTSGAYDARSLPWASLRHAHLQALRGQLAERYAPKTVNRTLSAVRGVLRAAWRLGHIDTDTLHRACDVGGVRGSRLPAGRDVAMRERQQLFEVCADDPLPARGARDAAVLALLAGTGIRRAEAVAIDLEHVDLDEGGVRILGKGNKERRAYLVDGSRRALEWWLGLRGSEPGPLLYRVLKGGHIRPLRLRAAAVGIVVERRVREVGLRHATPHDFRRTFTGDLLDAGADLSAAQALLGHASPTTTARYDRRGERARRKAAELVSVPFADKSRDS